MKYNVVLSRRALLDLDAIFDYIVYDLQFLENAKALLSRIKKKSLLLTLCRKDTSSTTESPGKTAACGLFRSIIIVSFISPTGRRKLLRSSVSHMAAEILIIFFLNMKMGRFNAADFCSSKSKLIFCISAEQI